MKPLLSILIFSVITFSCSRNQSNQKTLLSERINNFYFDYFLSESKFTDSLKLYTSEKTVLLCQNWDNGKLISTSVIDESGKTRHLKLFERTDTTSESISFTRYYFDVDNPDFRFFLMHDDITTFYKKHAFPSTFEIYKDSINIIDLYNFPKEFLCLDCKNGEIEAIGNRYQIRTHGIKGDTVQLMLIGGSSRSKYINLIIK